MAGGHIRRYSLRVADLAGVIVDEEQDPSYKQEEMPRYLVRDVA